MQKILIRAPEELARKLEESLRRNYDTRTEPFEEYGSTTEICEIRAKIVRQWITICRFASDESLKNIITMFKVNLEIKRR
jgi:hypothetical protein